MNKKLLMGMFAAGMLFATSCSNDEVFEQSNGTEAKVSFVLNTEMASSRVISDGSGATELTYAVFDANGNRVSGLEAKTVDVESYPYSVNLELVKGKSYVVAFWAQNPDATAYTLDKEAMTVTVDYAGYNNDETRDAFFKAEAITVTGDESHSVVLTRPFAQVNVGVSDFDKAAAAGFEVSKTATVLVNAFTKFDIRSGAVSDEAAVSYSLAAIPAEKLTVSETEYTWLSMSYILVDQEKSTIDAEFSFVSTNGETLVFDQGLDAVPVQRNWRTNIIGKLLTGSVEFNVSLDPIYAGDYNYPDYEVVAEGVSLDAANSTYMISSKAGLVWVSEQSAAGNNFKGYTVKVVSDINMSGVNWNPIAGTTAFLGTFDGNNKNISNLTVSVEEGDVHAGLFSTAYGATIKNVKLTNVNISGYFKAGAIAGDGLCAKISNCTVDGGTITSTPNSSNDDGNNVGGIVGYLSAESNAYVKDCTVQNLTLKAYRDVAGVVGKANGYAVVTGNTVNNVDVIADQMCEYYAEKPANAGQVVGANLKGIDLSSNSVNNVTVSVYAVEDGEATVYSDESLAYALSTVSAGEELVINLAEGTYVIPTSAQNKTLSFVGTSAEDCVIEVRHSGSYEGCNYNLTGSDVNFENVTISTANETNTYLLGFVRADSHFKNCIFDGTYTSCGNSVYDNCVFNESRNEYNIWTWYSSKAVFNNCKFNTAYGKAILFYGGASTELELNNCVFNDNNAGNDKSAVEVAADDPAKTTKKLTMNKCTVNGFAIHGADTTLWGNKNSMDADHLNVYVDGVAVYGNSNL